MTESKAPDIDVRERGIGPDGQAVYSDRRLFMQLCVFRAPRGAAEDIGLALTAQNVRGVVYEDLADPCGIGVLTWSELPDDFVERVRPVLADPTYGLVQKPEYTMLGRTYSTGYETDLPSWLVDRPIQTVTDARHPWAVWYPLRRTGSFARLPPREQGAILKEHGVLGRAYGAKDLAHDVRLACHGLDARDNEFVIGLIGKDLYPLSHVVQAMRKTQQTSEYIAQMGPFFVGRVAFRRA
jgi:hypothetical protein